ncbi:uncharacterized protein PGTG_07340 [Puccinia graminis f. sp. tritici CRL 75-36-700-3]|uniref:Uncharacterized protein n=1 Tax=Puccinia graminis f. sp. tritici (strain CRL 75-36-700-3 / race SCCL) TaxID=418459 RepID=E3K9I0_PUCGT|nr:uncharacterized protein PGTG_07340 [Puccinia graminis f. sp. tritici CRL 75-36-700-3]EFP81088.1 hypothetical protein PGTG_07340 [Puccinia graminis f. sp. tritici CRL 75-36-700-3]
MAIQLLTFQLTANIQSVDGSFMRKSTVKGNTGLHQIIQECDHSPKEGKISCGCYSNKILTRGFKELSATKATNSSLKDGEISNKGKIRSEPWKAVYACYSKTIKDFTAWRSDYTKLKLDEETNQEVEVHLKEVINSVENLFEKKLHQLESSKFRLYNFDLILSLKESPLVQRMSGLFKILQQEAWENIELNVLKVQIDSVLEIPVILPEDYSEEMKKTMKDVLQIISPKKGELPDIRSFLDRVLLPYIASDSKFFIRYHSKDLPASFIRDILNGSERFRKIRLFEEDIGLYYNVDQYKLDRILTERLSGLLHDGSSIDVSDRKLEQQIKTYLHQNQVLGGQPINIKQNILYRLLHVEEYYCTTIKHIF